jgi:hypothetical protein
MSDKIRRGAGEALGVHLRVSYQDKLEEAKFKPTPGP